MVFKREPIVVQTLIFAIINALIAFQVVNLTDVQIGALNGLLAAVLGFITRQVVTPLARPRDNQGRALVPRP